jgi:cation:H+ antiporter
VVAFGTSAPELVVSVTTAFKGESMIAVGNVVGSNICNIALVLGLSAVFQPIVSHPAVRNRDIPIMLAVSLLVLVFSLNSELSRLEGGILFTGIIGYTLLNYSFARRHKNSATAVEEEVEDISYVEKRWLQVVLILVGITGVVVGAQLVVDAAVEIMDALGVDRKFIGLTLVAFGTSLPELATSVVAAIRKEMDISIGNLVGSNVFNLMSVLGASALVRPIPIQVERGGEVIPGFFESGMVWDYAVMFVISALPLFLLGRNHTVSRWGGALLLLCYVSYFAYLISVT